MCTDTFVTDMEQIHNLIHKTWCASHACGLIPDQQLPAHNMSHGRHAPFAIQAQSAGIIGQVTSSCTGSGAEVATAIGTGSSFNLGHQAPHCIHIAAQFPRVRCKLGKVLNCMCQASLQHLLQHDVFVRVLCNALCIDEPHMSILHCTCCAKQATTSLALTSLGLGCPAMIVRCQH